MEWVETTGRSIDDAKDRALDQLGVAEDEAEFEVVEDAKAGLFGRVRREARIRARVKPVEPRPKQERGRNDRRGRGSRGGQKSKGQKSKGQKSQQQKSQGQKSQQKSDVPPKGGGDKRRGRSGAGTTAKKQPQKRESKMSDVTLKEHGEMVTEFVDGLIDAFGFAADSEVVTIDDETLEIRVSGDDLGLLIGPKGQTLQAIQSLSRTVVQRRAEGRPAGRVRIDVGGYRERRRVSLEAFVAKIAAEVVESSSEKALEPMGAADRKVVHDALTDVDGVKTISEGEDPRRRVVIVPTA